MSVRAVLCAILVFSLGCGDDGSSIPGGGEAGGASGGGMSAGGASSAGGGANAGGGGAAEGGSGEGGSGGASPPSLCDFAAPAAPPAEVLWPAELSATGAGTLHGHGHDDGLGPVGYCAGTPVAGQPFYRLIGAGFESDEDIDGDGQAGNDALTVDFYRDPATFVGLGESGGRVNVYVEIVDADTGEILDASTAPEIRIARTILDGPSEQIPLDDKPPNEFQTNFPMVGGGVRYGVAIEGASDRVINLRLPVNHHVCYVLVFERSSR